MRSHYETLGVPRDVSQAELKRVYRLLVRELHPDVNPDSSAQERLKEVTAAYEVLSDPIRRIKHDADLDDQDVATQYIRVFWPASFGRQPEYPPTGPPGWVPLTDQLRRFSA